MAPPIPIGQFVPPVTGFNKSFIPVANLFDTSGNFRQRSVSLAKRRRGPEGDALDNVCSPGCGSGSPAQTDGGAGAEGGNGEGRH